MRLNSDGLDPAGKFIAMRPAHRGEVQVNGEAVVAEVGFLEGRPALEDQDVGENAVPENRRQGVAQREVLLDHLKRYTLLLRLVTKSVAQRPWRVTHAKWIPPD